MKTLLALLLLIPSLSWGDEIKFDGFVFKSDTEEFFIFYKDGSFAGSLNYEIEGKYEKKYLGGAWESKCFSDKDYCNVRIYSGNISCGYYVYFKKPSFYWFENFDRNFKNVCFDFLAKRKETKLEDVDLSFLNEAIKNK